MDFSTVFPVHADFRCTFTFQVHIYLHCENYELYLGLVQCACLSMQGLLLGGVGLVGVVLNC